MLIAFCGEPRCGKDTAATYLSRYYNFRHYKFASKLKRCLEILFDLPDNWTWDYDKETPRDEFKGYSSRQVLQWYGTEGLPSELCTVFQFQRQLYPMLNVLFEASPGKNLNEIIPQHYDISEVITSLACGGFRHKVSNHFWVDTVIPRCVREVPNWYVRYNIVFSDLRFPNEFDFIQAYDGYLIYIDDKEDAGIKTKHESESYLKRLYDKADYRISNNGTLDDLWDQLEVVCEEIGLR